ncbi:carbohydrate kinase family protein [Microvirga makkahensis]|uniref:Carbohydrate kinase n=1 Tax=Microvirga makkahensis TaxID=1128670 RepID=A0A7X3MW95_9HYPH|nr:carbohydrate kinase family protein [Microvirga makkahensis]MXQ14110.1 carbohydrate kinase [Microvirga makkahensis]
MSPGQIQVTCIGGATVDRKYRAGKPVQLRTSNPVTSERSFGGVARNVAENIARLGVKSSLVSLLGRDEDGNAIRRDLMRLGIGTQHLATSGEHPTAEYVAILGPDGDLALGLADMAIFDSLSPSLLHQVWPETSSSWVFADCNLPSPTLHDLLDLARRDARMLAIDAVSTLKVMRLPRDLNGVGLLFLNLDEAQAFLGHPSTSPRETATALLECGAARVVLTLGAGGLIAMDRTAFTSVASMPAKVVDATGAGDALIGGTLAALFRGQSLAEAVRTGTVAAALTVECPHSVRPDLSPALLASALARCAGQKAEGEFS